MSHPLSSRDTAQLSAYLDGKLTPADKSRLEARLAAEPAFRDELAELKNMVQALRGLPEIKVPRNFTLTPAMAKRPWSLPSLAYPALRLATAMATAAFAFVLVLDFNVLRQPLAAVPFAAQVSDGPAAQEELAMASEAASMAAATEAPELLAPTPVPEAGGEVLPHGDGRGTLDSATPGKGILPLETEAVSEITGTLEPSPGRNTAVVETPTVSVELAPAALDAPPAVPPANPYRPVTIGLGALTLCLVVVTLLIRRNL